MSNVMSTARSCSSARERISGFCKAAVSGKGVPEAIDARREQFGTDRLTEALNSGKAETPQEVLRTVNQAVNDFVKDAPQFVDSTPIESNDIQGWTCPVCGEWIRGGECWNCGYTM
jgi:hypothetical protein